MHCRLFKSKPMEPIKHLPLSLMLADNDTDDCHFFKQALVGFNLETALSVVHDGEKLMEYLNQENGVIPDVLFLDLNMPRKNGQECLEEIRKNKKLDLLPVIIFSTSYEQDVVNLLYTNGAQYFIRKPPEFSQFKKIIQHTLTSLTELGIADKSREGFVLTIQKITTL
jgi:CheY-like chemotaxis protein